ncbi:hypothetical protein ZWY2020_040042 [Hordeum vulgare]|nr:hypothetical protein ZWY2020_040042 [Hordeum vulgare]
MGTTCQGHSDASFLPDTGETSAGVIVRDHLGLVARACGKCLQPCNDAEEAEMVVVLYGLYVLRKYYYGPVCVESDCATFPALLGSTSCNQSALFPLVTDVSHLTKTFEEVPFQAVKRMSNKMAHELAALARRQGEFFTLGNVPPILTSLLKEDCNFLLTVI